MVKRYVGVMRPCVVVLALVAIPACKPPKAPPPTTAPRPSMHVAAPNAAAIVNGEIIEKDAVRRRVATFQPQLQPMCWAMKGRLCSASEQRNVHRALLERATSTLVEETLERQELARRRLPASGFELASAPGGSFPLVEGSWVPNNEDPEALADWQRSRVLERVFVTHLVLPRLPSLDETWSEHEYRTFFLPAASAPLVELHRLRVRVDADASADVVAAAEERAIALYHRARLGAPFCHLVAEYSDQASPRCGRITPGGPDASGAEALFDGEIAPPQRTSSGFQVVMRAGPHPPSAGELRAWMRERAWHRRLRAERELVLGELRARSTIDVRFPVSCTVDDPQRPPPVNACPDEVEE